MDKLVDWLSHNPAASIAVIVAFSVAVILVTVIYAVAFFQGRAVSFWPPKIGIRPAPPPSVAKDAISQNVVRNPMMFPDRGTSITSSRGEEYSIGERIHASSTGALHLATCKSAGKVVVKFYWQGVIPNSRAWNMFNRECRASESLKHRNIAQLLDRGVAGGYPFLILEYFAGGTLRDWLDTQDRVSGQSILSIGTQVADAVDFAHSQGVVHRDLKPSNILFESDSLGRVAVSDFGIARVLGPVQRSITADFPVTGTLDYLAPELVRGEAATPSADIYSFGTLLFEMIAGRKVHGSALDLSAVLLEIATKDAPDIRTFRSVPDRLSDRIATTLNLDPSKRPRSARAVLAGIEEDLLSL